MYNLLHFYSKVNYFKSKTKKKYFVAPSVKGKGKKNMSYSKNSRKGQSKSGYSKDRKYRNKSQRSNNQNYSSRQNTAESTKYYPFGINWKERKFIPAYKQFGLNERDVVSLLKILSHLQV
ncbi:MAG: hypothetical protein ACI4M6_01345 [Christensenellaceae bacterium]